VSEFIIVAKFTELHEKVVPDEKVNAQLYEVTEPVKKSK
jgi:hypothetical protein